MIHISLWLLLTVVAFDTQTWAYDVFSSAYLYELGFYGLYPTTSYKSSELTPPRLNFPRWDEQNCSDGHYLIAQKGKIVSDPGPTIFDSRGELVWADYSYGVVFNLQVQKFKGENYLTFWSSPDGSSHGYGRGTYYMLDSSYELFRKFEPAGEGLKGDLHEFRVTEHGTALVTIYNPVPADLTSVGGPEQGWVLDCMVQEIDVDTGELLFEWSAIEHVTVNDTIRYLADEDDGTTPETAFDFFHINSVDVDGEGNYIVSGRHTSSVMCISPKGETRWTLGGLSNDFHDLSDGAATDFMYQHHAQPHANSTLSIFDNAASERSGRRSSHGHSRGLLVRLDTADMTATLLRDFHDPSNPRAAVSQGSMQVLDDRVVLGYGWLPFVTEFARDDDDDDDDDDGSGAAAVVLCEVELAPWVAARWGLVNTYRAFKTRDWVGRPAEPPSVYLDPADARAFVSWNGATEVERWVLQGAEWADLLLLLQRSKTEEEEVEVEEGFVDLDDVRKESFETAFDILDDMPRYLRVAAVDRDGRVLMHSQVVDRHVGNAAGDRVRDVLVWMAVFAAATIAGLLAIRKRGRRALLGNSTRGCELLARAASVCRARVVRALPIRSAEDDGGGVIYERYPGIRWWTDWGGAKAHELKSIYHD
ncbi:Arylsulfotransferase-domain-containing protein [Xylaria acuta]|nr:Arylsulfotransferase-domain-containing protein [Xylaria acuta]